MKDTATNRDYYDAFASRYETKRGQCSPGGYHELVDRLEAQFVERFGTGKSILEVGCGTGLVLERLQLFASHAQGVDLSPQMLKQANARGLDVQVGDATLLPFADDSFDVVCSFKVLAHIRDIDTALSEMMRVVRPGGHVLAEFYNPWSFRALVKRLSRPGRISKHLNESQVFTRYDSPRQARRRVPSNGQLVASRGIRIITPAAIAMDVPGLGTLLTLCEQCLCDSPAAYFGGFWIAAIRKNDSTLKTTP